MEEKQKLKFWMRIKQWAKKHRKAVVICGTILFISIIATATCYALLINKQTPKATPVKISKKADVLVGVKYYSPLTGLQIPDEAAAKQAVTGIMIENSPDARPQSGLKNSGVVFEAIAEGGITRFLVLYQQEKPQLIGPVRSVRPYYIDWAAGFNASIAHVGGSVAALTEVRNGNYRDIDQFFNADTYWRSTDRYAPHNVYTSFEKIDALNKQKGYTASTFTSFTRIDGKASDKPTATAINVVVSSDLYNSSYVYNKATNTYARSLAGEPHNDREYGQITPSAVIAMFVDESLIADDTSDHQSITTIGSGKALIFQNGTVTNANWSKASKTEQIKFTDESSKDIPLVRGQTWITAVPNSGGDVIWQ